MTEATKYSNSVKFEPYSNVEASKWVREYLGSSLIKTLSRTKYTAKVLVKTEDGEKEVIISLPRHILS